MDDRISKLKVFFRISNELYNCANNIKAAAGLEKRISKMQELHILALNEIEKEKPDLYKIENFISKMDDLININNKPNPKHQSGGIKINDHKS